MSGHSGRGLEAVIVALLTFLAGILSMSLLTGIVEIFEKRKGKSG